MRITETPVYRHCVTSIVHPRTAGQPHQAASPSRSLLSRYRHAYWHELIDKRLQHAAGARETRRGLHVPAEVRADAADRGVTKEATPRSRSERARRDYPRSVQTAQERASIAAGPGEVANRASNTSLAACSQRGAPRLQLRQNTTLLTPGLGGRI